MTDHTHTEEDDGGFRLTGWHVLAMLCGFFAVIFTVNFIFVSKAVSTFPGEDVRKSYVQGINYNDALAARAAQAELGWQAEMGVLGTGDTRQLVVRLLDDQGAGLSSLDVVVTARRLATDDADTVLTLTPLGDGEYAADASGLGAGVWDMRLETFRSGEEASPFAAQKRIMVR